MTRALSSLLLVLLFSGAAHAADDKKDEQKPQPVPTPAPKPTSPGWRASGMGGPAFLWSAGMSSTVTVSDQFAGRDESGWLLTVAPRLAIERPPARFSAWLNWEPSFVMREAGEFAGARSDLDGKPNEDASFVNQGSVGLRVGGEAGPRMSVEARRTHTTEAFFADERGLTDHVETGGIAMLALVSPQRAHIAASAGASIVEYSADKLHPLYAANHQRLHAMLDIDSRVLLRTSVGLRGTYETAEYAHPPEESPIGLAGQDAPRTIDTVGALLTIGAQVTPAFRFDLGAGASQRTEEGFELVGDPGNQAYVPYEESMIFTPINARFTMDVRRRARVELLAGTTVRDSLWRTNRWVRVDSGELRFGTAVVTGLDLGTHAGVQLASYPEKESPTFDANGQATSPPAARVDTTFTAGASLSYHPQSRLRLTLAYDRLQRDAGEFEQYEWEENRISVSAFLAF